MMVKTSEAQRRQFWRAHQDGATYAEIAAAHGLSTECIRYWCRRQRDGGSVQTSYEREERGLLASFDRLVPYVVLRLRLEHPGWGPGPLRYHLAQRPSLRGKRLPSESQIGRYLHQWPRFRRQPKRKAVKRQRAKPATRVHQRWQVDFKESIPLDDGTLVNLHTVRDVVGGVTITAAVTPAGRVGRKGRKVTLRELQTTLRAGFLLWNTRPQELQTDGEALFIGDPTTPFPTPLTLWLKGLDIAHLVIRAGKPTDNAEVERSHRTVNEYTIRGQQHLSAAELQASLDTAVLELALELPSQAHGCHGLPPVTAHPQLLASARPFRAEQELALFDLARVDAYLATFTWTRKVGKTGQICIGGHHHTYSVGRHYARQQVLVRFDPDDRHFVFFAEDEPEREIGRRPARHIDVADLTGLVVDDAYLVPQQLPLPLSSQGVSVHEQQGV
jgi:transposase InsO family protein